MKEHECKPLFSSAMSKVQSSGSSGALSRKDCTTSFYRDNKNMLHQLASGCKCASALKKKKKASRIVEGYSWQKHIQDSALQAKHRPDCDAITSSCVTKKLTSEWHLSPELKPLGSASINTKIVCHVLTRVHTH